MKYLPRIILFVIVGILGIAFGLWKGSKDLPSAVPEVFSASPSPTAESQTVVAAAVTAAASSNEAAALNTALNATEQRQLAILNEILISKNDNDPRMDSDLRVLSPALKSALQKQYLKSAAEKRNERGTIVFLLGRNLDQESDLNFMKQVLMEPPCLSLSDCSKVTEASHGEQAHLDGINELTANYPQLMAIRQLKQTLENGKLTSQITELLQEATHSPNRRVAESAAEVLAELKR